MLKPVEYIDCISISTRILPEKSLPPYVNRDPHLVCTEPDIQLSFGPDVSIQHTQVRKLLRTCTANLTVDTI